MNYNKFIFIKKVFSGSFSKILPRTFGGIFTVFFLFSNASFSKGYTKYTPKELPKELQVKFQDWSVFKTKRGDKDICYMASTPIKSNGSYYKRGEPYFLVTNIVNDADEISAVLGFFYRERSDVELSFGSKKFYLFPYLSIAWANDKNDDIDIIKQMQKSEEMVVSGISKSGKVASDVYSLIGFIQAYSQMKEICHGYDQSSFSKRKNSQDRGEE